MVSKAEPQRPLESAGNVPYPVGMERAIDQVDYEKVPGEKEPHKLTVFSLSTCAFCRKAQSFLKDHGLTYQYIYLDQIDFDLKREVKKELKSKFESVPVFPILLIDDDEVMSGFIEDKWASRLGIES